MLRGEDKFKPQEEVDQSFRIYEAGVLRLKDLEDVLNHLNSLGFWKEEKSIREKIRSVGEIPNIEKELEELKRKIIRKHGKKNLYKKRLPSLRRSLRKKKEILVGDIPSPTEVAEENFEKRPLIRKLIPLVKASDKEKKYASEIKDAIVRDPKKPIIVDSAFSEEQRKEQIRLEAEKAKLVTEKNLLDKKEKIIDANFKKYHDVPLSTDKYSYDQAKSREIVSNLKDLYARRGKNRLYKGLIE